MKGGGGGGNFSRAGGAGAGKFLTLEDECNWILSGRAPVSEMYAHEQRSDDEDTLDDISGDEVTTLSSAVEYITVIFDFVGNGQSKKKKLLNLLFA